jgi:lipopolysaccharide biosynthesis glycosyltransferase
MHIVTASDENYVPGVFVLLSSAIKHNPEARFTILTTNWSQGSLDKLQTLRKRLGFRVDTIEISADSLAKLPITRTHLTGSTYSRLFIADLLPKEDRVIYMDCDMLVTGSLAAAWTCDLTDKVLAAVRCPTPTPAFAAALNLPIDKYFNAGFLVINLALWRAEGVAATCFAALADPDCAYLSQDESALNAVASGRVLYLDAGLDFYALDTIWQSPLCDPQSIKVIHYVTRPKPWSGPCPFGELWLAEIAGLPEMVDFVPSQENRRAKLTRWNRLRKAIMGRALGKPRYMRYREAHRLIHNVLVPAFLAKGRFPE